MKSKLLKNLNFKHSLKNLNFKLIFLTAFLIIGILFSKNPMDGWYGLLKLLEFGFVGFYTAYNINKLKLRNILLMLSAGIIFESLLSIAQYFNHGSLQGFFYFFGERFFNSQTPGIANASLGGQLFLRPYGTFPHPNVLSGYLIIVMTIVISNLKSQISNLRKILYSVAILIGTIALFLTLSRVTIILWILVLIFSLGRKLIINHSSFIILGLVGLFLIGLVTPLGARFTELKLTDESVVQRESLIQSSLAMIKDHPLNGVGLNNFLVNLPNYQRPITPPFYLQPVHNIFLLIFSETGIIGLSFFIWFLIKTYARINDKGLRIKGAPYFIIYNLSFILILGLFDHYFLTLQQGQLLFSFILGFCWSKKLLG